MLQIEDVSHIVARTQHRVYVLLRVRCTDTEPHAAGNERRRGVRYDHNDDGRLPVFHHPVEHIHLARVEQQERHDGRGGVPVRDKTQLDQALVEIP